MAGPWVEVKVYPRAERRVDLRGYPLVEVMAAPRAETKV